MAARFIRSIEPTDEPEWRRLWTAYLQFYDATVPEKVYRTTWKRLHSAGEYEPKGMLAIVEGTPVGLVHYIFHRTCWAVGNNCYLQDLYADPHVRGTGIGRNLIEAVYAEADKAGAADVYWLTQETNSTARRLYGRVGQNAGFIKYARN
jgi:GNAT superfamily N-acetyltransferase